MTDPLTRRQLLGRGATAGLGALVAAALPLATHPAPAYGLDLAVTEATLQAFADTILPGRRVTRTQTGQIVHPLAISGVDTAPGAVEADALALFHNVEVGFDALSPAFLGELEARSVLPGSPLLPAGDFLHLDYPGRVRVCLAGLAFDNPTRLAWEAAAAVPFTAFCAAALIRNATAADACGYRVMGLPGTAPGGYRDFSYRRGLSHERTRTGSLP